MKHYKLIFFGIVIYLSFLFFCFNHQSLSQIREDIFFDKSSFYPAVNETKEKYTNSNKITAGIIPHHLVASKMLAEFFDKLSQQSLKTIILIGPNHFEKGESKFITGINGWNTPFGVVETDQGIINNLKSNKIIEVNEKVLDGEHSMGNIMAYIKYYLPKIKVVPVVIKKSVNEKECMEFVSLIKKYLNDDVVVIASVDFSHYLSSMQAEINDEVSYQIIKNYDYPKLFTLNNDYLDSPASVGIVMMLAEGLNKNKISILNHNNSGRLLNDPFVETTSYYSLIFH